MWGTDMTTTVTVAEGPAEPLSSWPLTTARPSASVFMPPSAGPASRPWSRSARASANASGASAVARGLRLRHDHGVELLGRRFSTGGPSASKAPSSCGSPKATASRSASSHAEGRICCGCGASRPSRHSAWPCLRSSGRQRTVDAGEIRLSKPRPGATRPRRAGRGSVEANTGPRTLGRYIAARARPVPLAHVPDVHPQGSAAPLVETALSQFGVDPEEARNANRVNHFRSACLRELKKINRAWPDLHYRTATGAVVLSPSPPRIPTAQLRLVE